MQRLRAVRWVTPVHGAVAVPAAGTAKVQVDPPRSLLASLCERDVPWTTLGAAAFFTPLVVVDGLTAPHGPRLVLEVGLFALIPTVAATTCSCCAAAKCCAGAC